MYKIEHLRGEFSVENCMFWKHVEEIRQEYGAGGDTVIDESEGGMGGNKSSVRRARR